MTLLTKSMLRRFAVSEPASTSQRILAKFSSNNAKAYPRALPQSYWNAARSPIFCNELQRNDAQQSPPMVSRNVRTFSSESNNGSSSRRKLSVYDDSDNWEDWFSGVEYENAWEGLDDLDYEPLDKSTRYLVQLLQDLYDGMSLGLDRPTTARCNRAIQDLADIQQGGKKLEGRAQRADAILKRMQLFDDKYRASSETELPFELPLANRDTYFQVLKLYATTTPGGGREVPERCTEIVETMQRLHERYNVLELQPDVVIWNQVLSAWAVCKDDDNKAFEAANVLQRLKQKGTVDSSSYGHVLRACAFSDKNARSQTLASEIAIRVWKDFAKTDLKSTSYMYTFYLQACRHIADDKRREEQVAKAFRQCCKEGKVNAHVLHELKRVASKQLVRELLGRAIIDISRDPLGDAALAQRVPRDWTRNANVKTEWGW